MVSYISGINYIVIIELYSFLGRGEAFPLHPPVDETLVLLLILTLSASYSKGAFTKENDNN